MTQEEIIRLLLNTRCVVINLVAPTTDEIMLQQVVDPGKKTVYMSELFQLEDGKIDERLFSGSEAFGWHTLHLPTWSQDGEIYTPKDKWTSIRLSPLFHPSTRRIRLNHPSNPVLKGWFDRPGGTRVAFIF